ncbi:response regulator [Butyrivibrio sp. DSM 10294]|uniref:hybrid sensor histidine kinase/response regulator n=1 Tax=Butyrivibrio sp. DSM 10294 TaxID=2972457 RepID=UPI00234F7928|nr:two-component regulator propeller domain-containing protein [Butyrivibrio sp. DSM 10294]MDC7293385.1 response regulator [Butyrivibrio sp. DSM 10294]
MLRRNKKLNKIAAMLCSLSLALIMGGNCALLAGATDGAVKAGSEEKAGIGSEMSVDAENAVPIGGGFAASGQSGSVGYSAVMYDETNGLITSDANYILGSSDGYIWIGSYSGIFRYDGNVFEKIDHSEGLTSARGLFEDSKGRIWVGTNDNGVVVIDGEDITWITYKEGLPSSSIRVFAEDHDGNVYIGTTAGVCYADEKLRIHPMYDERLNEERVLRLDCDLDGTIYGSTQSGKVFSLKDTRVHQVFESSDLGISKITTMIADPEHIGYVYICTEDSYLYHGRFGSMTNGMKRISVYPLSGIHWINYDCGRIWISSINQVGYLDENNQFNLLEDLPVDSGIEMMTSDYQGNLWIASSNQGVVKIVSSNFLDMTGKRGLNKELVNTTCILDGVLYVGTDSGLRVLENGSLVTNALTKFIADARVRCIISDRQKNLWIATFNHSLGVVCLQRSGKIVNYTVEDGLPGNEIRCISEASDGSILVGTNEGLAVIKNEEVVRCVDASSGLKNNVFLTICEGDNGNILAGTDGDGIYVIQGVGIDKIGRTKDLTSDVVRRIKKDNIDDLYWVVTSNSIEYLKDGAITPVTTVPISNNYDLFFDDNNGIWIVSSYGIYNVSRDDMLNDSVTDYRLFTMANGLSSTPTSNSFSCMDADGNIYIAGRHGVCKVNTRQFFRQRMDVKAVLKSVYCGDERILPDEQGRYVLPSADSRVKISAAVLDYTLVDPQVHIYMDGNQKDDVLVAKSKLTPLEYTGMSSGDYTLHLQVLAGSNTQVILENSYSFTKQPRMTELLIVRILGFVLIAAFAGLIVWRVMAGTVIRRQYDEIKHARDEAQRANSAKTRFLANISHEIRTPINTILGMDEMIMREDPANVPKGYFLAMMNYALDIKNASDALLGLINDLLDISKIESGKMHLVEQEYDVSDLLRSIVSMIRVKSTEKELTFDVVVDETVPTRLYGDAGKIKQIVINLLTNAVKYTEKGGLVLSVSMPERQDDIIKIRYSVKDTGIGVKAEDKEKLFTAYERLDEQKNSAIQGTGLGLDISRRFAELMGGTLVCESVYGEGSDFILTIEQKIVDRTPIGFFVEHDESVASGPYVPQFIAPDADVLVVDDTPMNLTVIKGLLKATKIFVTTAESGEECLEKMKTTRFNVVLLDHMMPGMDGVETVAKIRETDKDIPVYALTANASVGEEFYRSKGFTGYLAKPIDSLALEKTIMKHLPEEIMYKPTMEDAVAEPETMPEDLDWIREIPEISVDEGIKNSGGISSYIYSLKLFLDTIDGNAKVISDAYENDDIRLYTIKVHALKSSARIIGALEFSAFCASLEDAGNKKDKEYIDMNTEDLLRRYLEFKGKLSKLSAAQEPDNADDKEDIPPEELADAYSALKDVVPQMDYDAVEFILNHLKEYRLPKEDEEKVAELTQKLKVFDWEGMEELIK